jgi:UDP-4-amino-4,6-dideoxy-N-acetyl-beta-L-altrosamine transaminase/dTDP-4-dehydrorhamnose reductase
LKKKILFLGGSSLLAHSWCNQLIDKDQVIIGIHNRPTELDGFNTVSINFNNLENQLRELDVETVINCIGYTNVENCEINPEKANEINVDLPSLVSQVCKSLFIKLVHISTDHLFDGKIKNCNEITKVNPLNVYAKTKHEGEIKVLKINSDALVIRTNFYAFGPTYKKSFSDFIIDNLKLKKNISLFSDVYYSPILVSELAGAIEKLIEKKCSGIYNVVSDQRISKLDFGIKIANEFLLDKNLISSVSINSRNDLVDRPSEMSLSINKLKNEKIFIKSIDDQIKELKIQFDNLVVNPDLKKVIPYGRQNISDEDIKSVVDVLKSDYLTQGPELIKFEKAIANYTNSEFGVGVNSATSALHISCMALGLSENDVVWTSPISFVASSNCALYCGAKVDFIDIDSRTYNMSIESLTKKLEIAKKEHKLPKIVIPVHLSGQSCEMKEIFDLSKQYGFKIIEDASHAIGAKYKDKPVGNCMFSDITVFSFHPVKIITSGEGGMCTTNSQEIANLLCRFRSHGITRHEHEMTRKPDGPWYYEQLDLGYNYRMTDIQAALGLSQLKRLDKFISKRHQIVKRYNLAFEDKPIITPFQDSNNYSSFHLYIIRIKNAGKGLTRLDLFKKLREAGILVNIHYIPIYKQPFYQKIGYDCEEFLESEKYYEEAISLPIHTLLSDEEQDYVIENVLNFLSRQKTYINNIDITKNKGFQNIF